MIEKMKEEFEWFIDTGITLEIKVFFDGNSEVESYEMIAPNHEFYEVHVVLHEFNEMKAKQIFLNLVQFIEYPFCTYYEKIITGKTVVYNLLTANDNKKGFQCKVNFR